MTWTIKYSDSTLKELRRIDKPQRQRIVRYLDEVISSGQPRNFGKALTGNLSGLWCYRVGNYRVVAEIRDGDLVVIAVKVAHRSEIYKRS